MSIVCCYSIVLSIAMLAIASYLLLGVFAAEFIFALVPTDKGHVYSALLI
jgi:hypothetical protein